MGDIGDAVFGSEPEAETSQHPTMTPSQSALLEKLLKQFSKQAGKAAKLDEYKGPFAEPLSNLQKLSLSAIENLSKEMGSTATYQAADQALLNQLQTGGKQDITETFEKSVVNPYTKNFMDTILPSVYGNFGGTGAYGSDKLKMQNLALRDLNDSILSEGSKLSFTAGNEANKNILQALGLTENVLNIPMNAAVTGLNAGSVIQNTGQKAIDNKLNYIQNRNQLKQGQLQAMLAALGLRPFENITTVSGGSSGIMGNVISAAGTAAGGGFFGSPFG